MASKSLAQLENRDDLAWLRSDYESPELSTKSTFGTTGEQVRRCKIQARLKT